MATTTGPNLETARKALERLMDDTCVIRRNPLGPDDDVYDADTLRIVPTAATEIYEGRCKVRQAGLMSATHGDQEGGATILPRIYLAAIPIQDADGDSTPEVKVGDELEYTSSRRDPQLVGRVFRVDEVIYGTFSAQRRMVLELRQEVPFE